MSTPPEFSSTIPEHLLTKATPEIKWIMENMSVLTQKSDYLVTTQQEQSATLGRIITQCEKTNGRVTKNEAEISTLKQFAQNINELTPDLRDIIGVKHFSERYLFNKYSFLVLCVFILGAIQVIRSPHIRELFASMIG